MIDLTRQSKRLLKSMESWPEREPEAEALAIGDVAAVLLRLVRASAPNVNDEDYAKDLEAVFVPGDPPMAGVVHPGKVKVLEQDESRTSLTYIIPGKKGSAPTQSKKGAPKASAWVEVLARYNPWPFTMIPPGVDENARLVVRKASLAEINRATMRLKGVTPKIQSELRGAGAPDIQLGRAVNGAAGSTVQVDLSFSVLRTEFGYNEPQRAHWRPALGALQSELSPVQRAFVAYVLHGRKSAFSVHAREVPAKVLADADKSGFGAKVGSAVGFKK